MNLEQLDRIMKSLAEIREEVKTDPQDCKPILHQLGILKQFIEVPMKRLLYERHKEAEG